MGQDSLNLVYAARAADVRHVMVGGRWLLSDRQFTTLDWARPRRFRPEPLPGPGRLLPATPAALLNQPLALRKNVIIIYKLGIPQQGSRCHFIIIRKTGAPWSEPTSIPGNSSPRGSIF
jgi:hypothetical protein